MKFPLVKQMAVAMAAFGLCASASAQLNIDFSNARGIGTAPGKVLIENIKVLTPVTNPFTGTSTTVEAGYNVIFNFDAATLHLVPEGITQASGSGASNCATAEIRVANAVTGSALTGATVTMGSRTVTTNSLGIATFSQLPAGVNSVSVYSSGYSAAMQSASLSCSVTTNPVAVALSPSSGQTGGLTSGQFRVILTWGQNPSDLDSHMTGPNSDGTTRWHVYYSSRTSGGICGLDVDDTTSYGPETVTCPATGSTGTLRDGVYRYSVHHYSGTGNIGTSGASVRLEFANGTVYNYAPPAAAWTGSSNVWTVFELTVSGGTISVAPVNTLTTGVSSGSVRAQKAPLFGEPEDTRLFQNLSK